VSPADMEGDGAWAQAVACPKCDALRDWPCIDPGVEAVGCHEERRAAARRFLTARERERGRR